MISTYLLKVKQIIYQNNIIDINCEKQNTMIYLNDYNNSQV
jgi:hypothetical protein